MAQADPSAPVKIKDEETAIAEMQDDIHNDDEPTTDELVEMLREALREADEGKTRPIEELFREMDEILAEDANHR